MFDKILILSLNSYLEQTVWIDDENDSDEKVVVVDKGLNICRALIAYGLKPLPFILIGKENASMCREFMENYGIDKYKSIYVDGSLSVVRSSIENSGNISKKEVKPSTTMNYGQAKRIVDATKLEISGNTLLVVTGNLPEGMSEEDLFYILAELSKKGVNLALSTTEMSLEKQLSLKPWCIKMNMDELKSLLDYDLKSEEDIIDICRKIGENGVEHFILTAAEDGLYYSSAEKSFSVKVPKIDVNNSKGAGDMALAGFIYAMSQNSEDLSKALGISAAFGTASCLGIGDAPPHRLSFASILGSLKITQYN